MIAVKTAWRTWQPTTFEDKEAVRRELQSIVGSPHFCNSKRYPGLLTYIVENTLAGRGDELKERTLGIEVFQRPPDYDTHADTVVRYTAGEVRKRLSLYYHERDWDADAGARIQISLPAGSYVPEFLCAVPGEGEEVGLSPEEIQSASKIVFSEGFDTGVATPLSDHETGLFGPHHLDAKRKGAWSWRRWVMAVAAVLLVTVAAGYELLSMHRHSAVDSFWSPVLHGRGTPLVCTGSVVFSQNKPSGTSTAGKDTDYPFVSLQQAAAIGQIAAMLDHGGATYVLQSAPSTPLPELRERPVILLGGYNNDWTFRLQQPLRFQFLPEPEHAIADKQHAGSIWSRDQSLPYSNSDDYALIARFHDSMTDGVVVILAGIGRNGTEAAAQFVTSPHYMQLLTDRLGSDLGDRNIEVVLKINVIEGKTGAPTIQAVHVW
jgi:hypothetical protein